MHTFAISLQETKSSEKHCGCSTGGGPGRRNPRLGGNQRGEEGGAFRLRKTGEGHNCSPKASAPHSLIFPTPAFQRSPLDTWISVI